MDLPFEKQFHFRDGTSCSTLEQLKAKIESISYQEFYHHVNAEKNDFAAWIEHVLRDPQLAADLRKVTSIVETVEIINDFLHPRGVAVPRTDNQSRIEQDIYNSPMPAEDNEQLVVEQVPTTAPAVENKGETLDFRIIEEKAGITEPKSEPKMDTQVREELFGPAQHAAEATQAAQQSAPKVIERSDADVTRLIVKDFMYGLVFGLLIGLILGRIIS